MTTLAKPGRRLALATVLAIVVALAAAFGIHQYRLGANRFDAAELASYYGHIRPSVAQPVDANLVRSAIAAATAYIRRANDDEGQFTYIANLRANSRDKQVYSKLRHAGTVYALGMSHAVQPHPENVPTMARAVGFMRRCCLAPVDDDGTYGIWEPEGIVGVKTPQTFKLGGAGLGLVAMASVEAVQPGSVPAQEMSGLAQFGRFLQRRSGDFHGSYVPSEGGKMPLTVLYYPGEMVLGWLSLYEVHPDPRLIEWSVSALGFLADQRARDNSAPPDHWALLATAKLFDIADRDQLHIPRQLLLDHVLQICHEIIDHGYSPPMLPVMEGALSARGGTTPTSVRLEGLLAALTILPADHRIRPHVEAKVHRGIDFLLRAQIKDGPFVGGMPSAIAPLPPDGSAEVKKFNAQQGEIRIDYVQHALSALVQYLQWIDGGPAVHRRP